MLSAQAGGYGPCSPATLLGGCYAIRSDDDGAGVDFADWDSGVGVAMMTWHERALARMKELNLSQVDLSNHLGYSQTSVGYWFRSKATPTDPAVLTRIAKLLGVSVEVLKYGAKAKTEDLVFHTHTPTHSIRHALLVVDGAFLPGRYSAVNHVFEAWDGAGYYVVWPESWCDLAE